MKKLLFAFILSCLVTPAMAQYYGQYQTPTPQYNMYTNSGGYSMPLQNSYNQQLQQMEEQQRENQLMQQQQQYMQNMQNQQQIYQSQHDLNGYGW